MSRATRKEGRELLEQILKGSPAEREFLRILRTLPEQAKCGILSGKFWTQDFVEAGLTDSRVNRLLTNVLASRCELPLSTREISADIEHAIRKLIEETRRMPTGARHGRSYCAALAKLMPLCLGPIVAHGRVREECPVPGGWVDFEMPLRLSVLHAYPLWQAWRQDYGIRRILVESKNLKGRAVPDDVGQILRYQETADAGKFALLVSRKGFTPAAMDMMRGFARARERLIIPFDQDDLGNLTEACIAGREACMDYLNERQLSLATR